MSYTINIYGHGAEPDDVRGAFEEAVRSLRGATPEGGTLSGTCSTGVGPSIAAEDVSDEPGDDTDEGEDATAGEGEEG